MQKDIFYKILGILKTIIALPFFWKIQIIIGNLQIIGLLLVNFENNYFTHLK